MTQAPSGLLPALVAYYRRLEADPDQGVAEYGFSREKIHFQAVLEPDGTLVSLDDIRDRNDRGKPIPRLVLVPDGGGRSGTGMKPFFCWDNTGYALGRDGKGNPKRAAAMFAEFRKLHLSHHEELAGDEGFTALCRFLQHWDPARAEGFPNWEEAAGQNVVFKVRGRTGYVHESEAVRSAWLKCIAAPGEDGPGARGISLITGQEDEIARLHPLISGVAGANTTGAAIVSFNLAAFESYGKSQSFNAPVGERDAFRYTTALNRLLADSARRTRIGDATVVFWSDRAEGAEAEEMLGLIFGDQLPQGDPSEHAATVVRVRGFLSAAAQGRIGDVMKNPEAPFFILGLSPNASRLNVRYWLAGSVQQFAERLARHIEQLEMTGARPEDPPLTIRRLLLETAREPKDVSPHLAGQLARAVLEGTPYPRALLDTILRRVRIEADINHVKAACLKTYLVRNGDITMESSLNKRHPEPAYHCGRLLALLAFAQDEAIKSVNAGVVRRNMGAAMSTPGLVLGRLLRAAEVGHIPKLEGDIEKFVRDEMRSICVNLGDRIPPKLDLIRQGVFALGFYQEQSSLDEAKKAIQNHRLFQSEQGEWMASKLEVRVGNALAKAGIRYIYEVRAVLDSGQDRLPDFFIEGSVPQEHLYLEVLGFTDPKYDERWERKLEAYTRKGITPTGGENGRLAIFDWRKKWGPNPEKSPLYPSDSDILDVIRPYLPLPAAAE
ncbi:MAG: type I-C CRISPR-associated protein Cas8c/Csd1 [Isosphaeraceae bacterium]